MESKEQLAVTEGNKLTQEFKLVGLNRKTKTGTYGTVYLPNEDWFHADFDETVFPIDRQYALFDYMKHEDQRFKGMTCIVRFEGYSTGGMPINPIIIDIKNIQ
jgi:hypothetical protein